MKTFAISTTLALLVATISGAPSSPIVERQGFNVSVFFYGAGGASYFQQFPDDNSLQPITNPLSVSSISSPGGGFCNFYGIDGSEIVLFSEETVIVAPPQAQVSGSCQSA